MKYGALIKFTIRAIVLSFLMYAYVIFIGGIDWKTTDLEGMTPLMVKSTLFLMNLSVAICLDRVVVGFFSMVEFVLFYYRERDNG